MSEIKASALWSFVIAFAVLGLLILLGCDGSPTVPTISNSSMVTVQTGRGITNVCEIGMSFSELRDATHDATRVRLYGRSLPWKHSDESEFVPMPSIGAIGHLSDNDRLVRIDFSVRPDIGGIEPKLAINTPFRGKLEDKLSFNQPVARADVEAAFGIVAYSVTNYADAGPEFWKKHIPLAFDGSSGIGKLHYQYLGLDFMLKSNVVTSFSVYEPIGTNR